ncbi:metal ABC transporter permease [Alicyclobacillus sp. SO9]|uniref:metal ABC transporter permease n=1 Tax=Alicyclobacillus sp. SO9 TaxID=2665646 RepID=UPI0018E78046|nr:metal ABC transporter permease [Alicyclobacillus sp. SO9]QQE78061.1 metal ABC transporter permease [Alicyclobacillus sp. SO9]
MSWLRLIFQPGLFTQPFMVHAYTAGTMIALLSACIGVFIVLRKWTFVAHAIPKIGFAGAAGSILTGVNPLVGITVFSVAGSIAIGSWSKKGRNDVITALTLVLALGLGALFLAISQTFAQNAYALFFGQVVGISLNEVLITVALGTLCLLAMVLLYRPLLLTSIEREWAQARGVFVTAIDVLFLIVASVAAALTVPLIGILLNFSLLVAPAAAAAQLSRRPGQMMMLSIVISVGSLWLSLLLAYDIGWPVGFFTASVTTTVYVFARVLRVRTGR